MKLDIITCWWNEGNLAPFFFRHYSYVNSINIFLDNTTNDDTLNVIEKFKNDLNYKPNINLFEIDYQSGFDVLLHNKTVNNKLEELKDGIGWNIVVDGDEFIYKKESELLKLLENSLKYNVIRFRWCEIIKGKDEVEDLNENYSIMDQRKYGSFYWDNELPHKYPIIKKGVDVNIGLGLHYINNKDDVLEEDIILGNLAFVCEIFAIKRRMNRYNKLSELNKNRGWGGHWKNTDTVEQILSHIEHLKQNIVKII